MTWPGAKVAEEKGFGIHRIIVAGQNEKSITIIPAGFTNGNYAKCALL